VNARARALALAGGGDHDQARLYVERFGYDFLWCAPLGPGGGEWKLAATDAAPLLVKAGPPPRQTRGEEVVDASILPARQAVGRKGCRGDVHIGNAVRAGANDVWGS